MAIPRGWQGDVQSSYLTDDQSHPSSKELDEGHLANLYPRSLGIQHFWPLCHWPSPKAYEGMEHSVGGHFEKILGTWSANTGRNLVGFIQETEDMKK